MTLVAGPETDRLVAEAIKETTIGPDGVPVVSLITERYQPFRPSTDLNAAFCAAEQADFPFALIRDSGGSYCVASIDPRIGSATNERLETPSLAICAAILSLKGAKAETG